MAYDKAVFETLLVIDGQAVASAGHLERFRRATGINASEFLEAEAAKLPLYHRLRIDFKPGKPLSSASSAITKPDILDRRLARLKLVSKTLSGERLDTGYGPLKLADRQELEILEAVTKPALPLLVDGSGHLLETSRHNVFIIQNGELITPPLDGRILPGVTRRAVIEEAQELGIACREEPVTLDQAKATDGLFVTSAIIGIGWVEQCDKTSWTDLPSLLTTLHEAFAVKN